MTIYEVSIIIFCLYIICTFIIQILSQMQYSVTITKSLWVMSKIMKRAKIVDNFIIFDVTLMAFSARDV